MGYKAECITYKKSHGLSDGDDYDKLKKTLLTRYNFNEDGYRKRFREIKPETEERPDQLVSI